MITISDGYELSSIIQLNDGTYHVAVKRMLVLPNGSKLAIYGNAKAPHLHYLDVPLSQAEADCDHNFNRVQAHITAGKRYTPQPRHNPKLEIDIDLSDI